MPMTLPVARGRMMASGEFMRPRFFTLMKDGIMPPEKNMVKVMKKVTRFFPFRSGRDSGYAAMMVRMTFRNVPPTE